MNVEVLAALALFVVIGCLAMTYRRDRTPQDQDFACQVGDQVVIGRFRLDGGVVHVESERGSRSAPAAGRDPIHVAERLLAELHAG